MPHGEQRRVRLLVVAAGQRRQRQQVPRQAALGHLARLGELDDLGEHVLHRQRGAHLDAHPRLAATGVAEPVRDAGWRLDDLARPGHERLPAEPEPHAAGEHLEALGLDRVHVRDRDLAARPQREVEREQLAARAGRGVDEGEPLAGDGVRQGVAREDHDQAPEAAVARAYSPKSRGARPSALRTPSCGCALRPSSTSRKRNVTSSASSSGTPASSIPAWNASPGTGTKRSGAPGRGRDLRDRLLEAQRPRPGELVDLAVVAVLGQRGGRDVGDVLDVDERLGDVPRRHGDLAREDAVEQERLAEVLREPAAAHDGPLGARRDDLLLGALRLGLAAAGEQHQPRRRPATPRAARTRRPAPARPRSARSGK